MFTGTTNMVVLAKLLKSQKEATAFAKEADVKYEKYFHKVYCIYRLVRIM
jgi:hypothetical protein